jgi:acyl-CoA thioesterase-2
MGERETTFDVEAVLAETLELLAVRPDGEGGGGWVGRAPGWFGDYLFGGFVIAQAIIAATRNAPVGRRLHSMHAYFLRPVAAANTISYHVRPVREGRSFTTRHLEASQDGKPVLDMTCSFTADADADCYVYDLPCRRIPSPAELDVEPGPGPWVAAYLGPTPPADDGTRESTHRMWCRVPAELPDDEHLHTALLGFATDWTGVGGRPLHLEGDIQGMISLDHAAWFHRPARADAWLFYDVHSLVNAGGRGLLRGVMRDPEGRVVISVAQEMRLARVDPPVGSFEAGA